MRSPTANALACSALVAVVLTLSGCGDRAEREARGVGPVVVERATFPQRQHVGERATFALTVRNAGVAEIANLVVTLRGFDAPSPAAGRPRWLLDRPPPGTVTAIDDTWAAGPLAPGASTTLRWRVTAVGTGRHELGYAIATGLDASGPARLASGGPARGTLTARIGDRPAFARVDPRSGRVIRE